MNLKQFTEFKEKVDILRRKQDKTAGVIEEVIRQIKTEFGSSNIKEAEETLQHMKTQGKTMRANIDQRLEELERRWGDLLR